MKSRAIIPLVVGLVVGGIALKVFFNVLKKARGSSVSDTVEVIRAAADVAPGVQITEAMVAKAAVPKTLVPDGIFMDPKQVIGRVTSQMIPKGMPVTTGQLAPEGTPPGMVARIQDGYRAMAIQVDEIVGVGGFIQPGARVDVVMIISGQGRNSNISRVILQNVEVLAVGQKSDSGGQASVTRSVTLLVKPDEASKLSLASTKGKIRLALRSQDDRREPKSVTLTDEDLLADGLPSRNRNRGDNSVLERLFGNLSKVPDSPDDVKRVAAKAVPAAAPAKEWKVEVISGSEVYEVKFDSEGNSSGQVPTGTRSPNTSKSQSPANNRAVVPVGVQEESRDSTTTAAPKPDGQKAGGEEQDTVFEAPSNE